MRVLTCPALYVALFPGEYNNYVRALRGQFRILCMWARVANWRHSVTSRFTFLSWRHRIKPITIAQSASCFGGHVPTEPCEQVWHTVKRNQTSRVGEWVETRHYTELPR